MNFILSYKIISAVVIIKSKKVPLWWFLFVAWVVNGDISRWPICSISTGLTSDKLYCSMLVKGKGGEPLINTTCYKTLLTECHCPDLLQYSVTVFNEKTIYLVFTEKLKEKV